MLWIGHSVVTVALFGFTHQAGVVPALLAVNERLRHDAASSANAVVVWSTYMPPRQLLTPTARAPTSLTARDLLMPRADDDRARVALSVVDLAGAPVPDLIQTIQTAPTMLIAPRWAVLGATLPSCLSIAQLSTHWPHLDLDHLPQLRVHGWRSAAVGVWAIDPAGCGQLN